MDIIQLSQDCRAITDSLWFVFPISVAEVYAVCSALVAISLLKSMAVIDFRVYMLLVIDISALPSLFVKFTFSLLQTKFTRGMVDFFPQESFLLLRL